MCNPVWTRVRTPSVLGVEIQLDGDAGVTGSVVTREGEAPPRKRLVGPGDFPLELPVEEGTTHVVTVRAVSLGVEGTLTVTARLAGSDDRGPDACRLEVDDSHPVAIDTIIVVGA